MKKIFTTLFVAGMAMAVMAVPARRGGVVRTVACLGGTSARRLRGASAPPSARHGDSVRVRVRRVRCGGGVGRVAHARVRPVSRVAGRDRVDPAGRRKRLRR